MRIGVDPHGALWLHPRGATAAGVVRALLLSSTPFDTAREPQLPLWSETRGRARRSRRAANPEGSRRRLRARILPPGDCRGTDPGRSGWTMPPSIRWSCTRTRTSRGTMTGCSCSRPLPAPLGGLHPACGWLSCRIDLDREAACDDHVVARTGAAREGRLGAARGGRRRRPAAHGDRDVVPGATLRASAPRAPCGTPSRPGARRRHAGNPRWPQWASLLPVIAILASPRVAPLVAFVDAVELALPVQEPW